MSTNEELEMFMEYELHGSRVLNSLINYPKIYALFAWFVNRKTKRKYKLYKQVKHVETLIKYSANPEEFFRKSAKDN